MFHDRHFFVDAAAAQATVQHPTGLWDVEIERIAESGLVAATDAPLLAGEQVLLDLPGVGAVGALVTEAGRRRFTAAWSGSSALRLRFLAGWRGAPVR